MGTSIGHANIVTMELPIQAVYKSAKNGGQTLLTPDGYEFAKGKDAGTRIHFFCRGKTRFGCKVTAAVVPAKSETDTDMLVRVTGEHTHDNDIAKKTARDKENEAISAACSLPTVAPRTILGNVINQLKAAAPIAVNSVSKASTFARRLQRERNKQNGCTDIPTDWESMIVPDKFKKTSANEQFLIVEETISDTSEEKVVGFSSPSGLEVLDFSDDWYGDGTFAIVKSTLFAQVILLYILSLVHRSTVTGI